jgi:hypothetical protein
VSWLSLGEMESSYGLARQDPGRVDVLRRVRSRPQEARWLAAAEGRQHVPVERPWWRDRADPLYLGREGSADRQREA